MSLVSSPLLWIVWFVLSVFNAVELQANVLQGRKSLKIWNASRICVSSLRRGHANLLCIVPILLYVLPEQHVYSFIPLLFNYQTPTTFTSVWELC